MMLAAVLVVIMMMSMVHGFTRSLGAPYRTAATFIQKAASTKDIRNSVLTNSRGELKKVSDLEIMRSKKSVVVFLRHLGQ